MSREGGTEQQVGQVRVGRQKRAMQVRRDAQAEHAIVSRQRQQALRRVVAVVAMSVRNATERLSAMPKLGSTGMVLETDDAVLLAGESCGRRRGPSEGRDWRVGLESRDNAADQAPTHLWGDGLNVQQARPRQPVAIRGLIKPAEVLKGAAHGEQRCSSLKRAAKRVSEPHETARDRELIGVGATAGDDHIDVEKRRRIRFNVNRSQLNICTAPGRALNKRPDVACVSVEVQPFRKQLRDHDAQAG